MLLLATPLAAGFSVLQGLLCGRAAPTLARGLVLVLLVFAGELGLSFCCLPSLNSASLGFRAVTAIDPVAGRAAFAVEFAIALALQSVAVLVVARILKTRFDALLGRIGGLELNLEQL